MRRIINPFSLPSSVLFVKGPEIPGDKLKLLGRGVEDPGIFSVLVSRSLPDSFLQKLLPWKEGGRSKPDDFESPIGLTTGCLILVSANPPPGEE
jgi:hypothetical protein